MELFIMFCVLNVINVILQTIKSIVTVNCGKWPAAGMNAIAFGLYQVILVYAVCDLPLWVKVTVVALANFIGVFITKFFQEKLRKDKLWKVEATIPKEYAVDLVKRCSHMDISFNYVDITKYYLFSFYCPTQKESQKVKEILKAFDAKYFVMESKEL